MYLNASVNGKSGLTKQVSLMLDNPCSNQRMVVRPVSLRIRSLVSRADCPQGHGYPENHNWALFHTRVFFHLRRRYCTSPMPTGLDLMTEPMAQSTSTTSRLEHGLTSALHLSLRPTMDMVGLPSTYSALELSWLQRSIAGGLMDLSGEVRTEERLGRQSGSLTDTPQSTSM